MEIMGDMNQLSDEQRIALRSVIAAFNSFYAERPQRLPAIDKQQHAFDLTQTDLAVILRGSQQHEDIYAETRDDFMTAAPNSRTRLTPKKHLRY
jgi:hypothetical protein